MGEPHWSVEDYDYDPGSLQAAKHLRRAAGPDYSCQVEGCHNDLTGLRPFYQRLRICEVHAKAHSITDASGNQLRFCQQCSKLQPLSVFDGDRRSCVSSLNKRRARRTVGGGKDKGHDSPREDSEEGDGFGRRKRYARGGSAGNSGSSGQQASPRRPLRLKVNRGGAADVRSPGSVEGGKGASSGSGSVREGAPQGSPAGSPGLAGNMALPPWPLLLDQSTGLGHMSPLGAPLMAATIGSNGNLSAAAPTTCMPFFSGPPPGALPPTGLAQFQSLGAAGQLLRAPQAQAQAQQQQAAAALTASMLPDVPLSPADVDILLQLPPEDLAECLLGIHSATAASQPPASSASPAAPAGPAGDGGLSALDVPPLAAIDTFNGSGGPSQLSAMPAHLQPPQLPAYPSPGIQGQHSAGSGHSGWTAAGGASAASLLCQQPGSSGGGASGAGIGIGGALAVNPGSAASLTVAHRPLPPGPGAAYDDRLATFSLKLFGTTPDSLAPDLRAQLQTALTLTPTIVHASMRAGCVCLIVTALLSQAELARLEANGCGGLAGAVAAAVSRAQPGTRIMCQAGGCLTVADDRAGTLAHLQLPPDGAAKPLLAAPQLVTPAVLLSSYGSSQPVELVLRGPGLAAPGVALHCRSRGRHVVVTVLRVRRGPRPAGSQQQGGGAAGMEEPGTPPTAERRSLDTLSDSLGSDASSDVEEEGWGGGRLPNPTGRGAAAAAAPGAPSSAAQRALQALELETGEDGLLVQLAAPPGGWALFELEVARGPLLSAATPLLVLPAWASAAVDELAGLPSAAAASGYDPAAFLAHLGWLLQLAEEEAAPGAAPVEAAAAQRAARLARRLAVECGERGWLATARLLLPALGIGNRTASGGTSAAVAGKGAGPGLRSAASAARAALAADKSAGGQDEAALEALLEGLAACDAQQAAAQEAAVPLALPRHGARAELAAQLRDWLWAGANLAAGMASITLLLRNMSCGGLHGS